MANWNGLQLTNKGIALQAKVQAGTQLHITKLKLGSGVVPSGTDIKTLTDLIEPEQNLGIGGKEAVDDYCKISSTISNTGLEAGYYVRELGVFAQDPDDGEILYMYTTDGAPDYLPAGGGSTVISQEFSVMIAVDDTDNIVVDIDPAALATMGYVQLQIQEHNTDTTAHADFTGATAEAAGERGMVPKPQAGDQNKALFGDATYKQVVQKVNGVVADRNGNVNVDMSDYLPLTGGTLTGTFTVRKTIADYGQINIISNNNRERRLDASDTYLRLAVMADEDTSVGGRYLSINIDNVLERALYLQNNISGEWLTYYLFGQHNIATQAQAEVGTDNAHPMTPLRTAQAINALALPKGTILPFAGGTIPSGFLACNGAAVSRTTYAALFSAIGTAFGEGNGSTTFNLPNVEDNRFLEFSTTRGSQRNAGLPDITGSMTLRQTDTGSGASGRGAIGSVSGAFSMTTDVDAADFSYLNITTKSQTADLVTLDATKSSSVYGNSTTVQPKSLTVRAIIKY